MLLQFPKRPLHARASADSGEAAGRKKASIGTSEPESSDNRLARPSEASLRPAKMFRMCHSEQPTEAATAGTVIPFRSAQASIGCWSDMEPSISTRNSPSQPKIFPSEISIRINGLVKCGMGKTKPAEPPEIFLGQWLDYWESGPTEAAEIAGCTQGYISNISRGRRPNVNYVFLWRIATHFGITVDDFFQPAPKALNAKLSRKARSSVRERERQRG